MPLFDLVSAWDAALLRHVNAGGGPWLDTFMAALSDWKAVKWPVFVLIPLLLLKARLRGRAFLLFAAAAILLGDAGVCQPLKRLVGRPRPYEALSGVRVVSLDRVVMSPVPGVHNPSMPSSHAFNIVVLALMLSVFYGRWAHLGWLFALLVGDSRVYTGAHYPSDVLAGLALGLAWGATALFLARKLWGSLGPRLCPVWHTRFPKLLPPEPPVP